MKCWFCSTELVWNNDFDYEDFGIDDGEGIVTVLICPKCNSQWEGYYDIENEDSNK
jgi:hypothetical protein